MKRERVVLRDRGHGVAVLTRRTNLDRAVTAMAVGLASALLAHGERHADAGAIAAAGAHFATICAASSRAAPSDVAKSTRPFALTV